jgi:hypothetical protein
MAQNMTILPKHVHFGQFYFHKFYFYTFLINSNVHCIAVSNCTSYIAPFFDKFEYVSKNEDTK